MRADQLMKARFWTKVLKKDGCWEWLGSKTSKGYGQIMFQRKNLSAHRLAYEFAKGPIPKGLQIDHLCRNKGCVNPEHLEAVTSKVNTLRGESFSAVNARRTHCKRGHLFAEDNLVRIRGRSQRLCKTCDHDRVNRWHRNRDAARRAAEKGLGVK